MKRKFFVGADISKSTIDLCVCEGTTSLLEEKIANTKAAITTFLRKLKTSHGAGGKNTLFCLEATSHYDKILLRCLWSRKASVWLESPLRIHRSLGIQRGKTDAVDAGRIAQYACRFEQEVKVWLPPRPEIQRLKWLVSLRERLQKCLAGFSSSVREFEGHLPKKLLQELLAHYKASEEALRGDLRKTEASINSLIAGDERLCRLQEILTSVPGVGPVLAVELLIHTNEFLAFQDPKPFACYCGVVPFEHSSGSSVQRKRRVSHLSNRRMKKALFFPAMASVRTKGDLQDYYNRKVGEGKPKMSVLNAVKNKLLLRIFACVRKNRPFQKTKSPPGKEGR